jgi:hypothetical protein
MCTMALCHYIHLYFFRNTTYFGVVSVPTTMLIPTDSRIRQSHPFTYRHLHSFKDLYKYSFFYIQTSSFIQRSVQVFILKIHKEITIYSVITYLQVVPKICNCRWLRTVGVSCCLNVSSMLSNSLLKLMELQATAEYWYRVRLPWVRLP